MRHISFKKINYKIESVLTVSSKTIQLEIRVVTKKQGGGGVRKLFHVSKQTKIKNKKGNKNRGYPIAISQQFQSIQVPIQPNTAELSPSSNFAFFFSVLYFLCGFQLFCLKLVMLMFAFTGEEWFKITGKKQKSLQRMNGPSPF